MEEQTCKMSIYLQEQIFFTPKFPPEAHKLRQNIRCDKTANNANITFCINITALIPFWYPEVNPF